MHIFTFRYALSNAQAICFLLKVAARLMVGWSLRSLDLIREIYPHRFSSLCIVLFCTCEFVHGIITFGRGEEPPG